MYIYMVIIHNKGKDQPGRETGSAISSYVSLLISILRLKLVLIYRIPPEFRGGIHL